MDYRLTKSPELCLEVTEMVDNGHNEIVPFTILFIKGEEKIKELLEVMEKVRQEFNTAS